MRGSFDGVDAQRWIWLGPSRTRLLKTLLDIKEEPKRLQFIQECLSPNIIKIVALGVPLEEEDNQRRMRYFANTKLLERHLMIAEKLLVLLFRVHQFSKTPEVLPVAFYNWLIPSAYVGRKGPDITNWWIRFLNASLDYHASNDSKPLVFGLLFCLMCKNHDYVETHWLQSCAEEVALQLWLAPDNRRYHHAIDPYSVGEWGNHFQIAVRWYTMCHALLEHFTSRYHVWLTTSWRRPESADFWERVDSENFYTSILLMMNEEFIMPIPRLRRFLVRWLTIWTFHCFGGLNEDWIRDCKSKSAHQLVRNARICGKKKKK